MKKEKSMGQWIIKTTIIFGFIILVIGLTTIIQYDKAQKFLDNAEPKIDNLLQKVTCEVNYKDFHYKGFCIERDDMWKFMEKQYSIEYPELPENLLNDNAYLGETSVYCYDKIEMDEYKEDIAEQKTKKIG